MISVKLYYIIYSIIGRIIFPNILEFVSFNRIFFSTFELFPFRILIVILYEHLCYIIIKLIHLNNIFNFLVPSWSFLNLTWYESEVSMK